MRKHRRELTAENKSLTTKLTAARDSARFADRRIAGLEARITGQ